MANKFVSVGECMVEMSGGKDGLFRLGFAGDTLNTAWYARAALGQNWDVEFLSALGDDIYSAQMRSFISSHQIGTDHIQTIAGKRPGLYLIHQKDGDRQFTYWRDNSAAKQLADDEEALSTAFCGAALIYFSGISLAILSDDGRTNLLSAIDSARGTGAKVAFDPNIRPALWRNSSDIGKWIELACTQVDIALPTFDDDAAVFGDEEPLATIKRYQQLGVEEVVVKNGAEPALVASGSNYLEVPAKPATSIDATGAGDSFSGTYLAARLSGKSATVSAKAAHNVASIVIGYPGGLVDPALLR